jgi:hypothetical protein
MPSPLPEVPARTVVREDTRPSAFVSAAQNDCHAREVASAAVRSVVGPEVALDRLPWHRDQATPAVRLQRRDDLLRVPATVHE